jgi:aerobic carbon-monoxide dehydrogenase medium subunit
MKPAPFAYHDPRTLDEAVDLLASHENAKLIAGGQSLVPMLNMRFVIADHVIDLNGVPGLSFVRRNGDTLEIGAMTRQRMLERDPIIARSAPIMREALPHVGHWQTRSRGTIGGSLCHLDPAAELPGVAALYDGTLRVAGPNGVRELPVAEWSLGYMTPALAADEVLTAVSLPLWREPHGHAFVEFARRHGDFAVVGVGCLLAVAADRTIRRAAIALIGVATAPVRLAAAEAALIGQPATPENFKAAAEHAREVDCLADAQVSAAYRKRLAVVLVDRALRQAEMRANGALDATH